ncbi:MAG: hypothetical protein GY756_10215, partial [bacterium]|nr:hypothetical protein [bacterium]
SKKTLISNSDSTLLIGCDNGLWEYNINNSNTKYLGIGNELLQSKINCIAYSNYNKYYWIGTDSEGIVLYNKDSTISITKQNGLSDNNINDIEIHNNIVWIATDNGINEIVYNNYESNNIPGIKIYNINHNLPSNVINDVYHKDNILYAATRKGVAFIDYQNIKKNISSPRIYINKVSVLNKDTVVKSHYKLPHHKNSITVEYVGLMYKNRQDKRYIYKLIKNNTETKWKYTTDTKVNFTFLSPGKYAFKVKAINEDNTESKEEASVWFLITPPVWKTWWFISLLILLLICVIVSIVYTFYKMKLKEQNKRNELEKDLFRQINKFRQQALSQQMNPHFLFNTLNSIQLYLHKNNKRKSTRYLSKFSRLMRIILENSQQETIFIQQELDALKLYIDLEMIRIEGGFGYEIKIDDKIDTSSYKVTPLLFQPFVENSIWHGLVHKEGDKQLTVELKEENDNIIVVVEDNGVGREKAQEIKKNKNAKHQSLGTNITGKRIELINKLYNRNFKVEYIDLYDTTRKPSGTKIILKIPVIINT